MGGSTIYSAVPSCDNALFAFTLILRYFTLVSELLWPSVESAVTPHPPVLHTWEELRTICSHVGHCSSSTTVYEAEETHLFLPSSLRILPYKHTSAVPLASPGDLHIPMPRGKSKQPVLITSIGVVL